MLGRTSAWARRRPGPSRATDLWTRSTPVTVETPGLQDSYRGGAVLFIFGTRPLEPGTGNHDWAFQGCPARLPQTGFYHVRFRRFDSGPAVFEFGSGSGFVNSAHHSSYRPGVDPRNCQ
jgi:hypothetical protein